MCLGYSHGYQAINSDQPGYSGGYTAASDRNVPNTLSPHRISKRQEEPELEANFSEHEDFSFEIRDLYSCQCTAKREAAIAKEADIKAEAEASGYPESDFSFEITAP